MREWIVVLEKDIDYNTFWDEIENDSPDDGFIPSRRVDIANERPGMRRMCHYMLSDIEAEELRNDNRVLSVELPFEDDDNDEVMVLGLEQDYDFDRSVTSNNAQVSNWGLIRCNKIDKPESSAYSENYSYTLDGTGVDVVILDTGIVADHPEWEDADGNSRLQQIDWFAESGVSGTQHERHYEDTNGHGSHCAGIAAGKTFGWAKNARIYAISMGSVILNGGNPNGIQSISQVVDVLLGWHNNKPIDPATGYKRPTIVNASWNIVSFNDWDDARYITWRGNRIPYSDFSSASDAWEKTGLRPNYSNGREGGTSSNYVNTSVEELIDAGIHICNSAGNGFRTLNGPGDIDYSNVFEYYVPPAGQIISSSTAWRPGAPYVQDRMFLVGNIDNILDVGTQKDRKNGSSNSGPAVNIFAPGTNIMSSYVSMGEYYADANYNQALLTGTSMAAPQVCGVGALVLQANPWATPEQLIAHILGNGGKEKIKNPDYPFVSWTQETADYTDNTTTLGANNVMLYNIFNNPIPTNIG